MRYIYDPLIADRITEILYSLNELSSNKLRIAIKEVVKSEKYRMRKNKRDGDRNDHYVPSPAKISITLEKLTEWQWIEKRNDSVGKLKKVFYCLSEDGKFGTRIGLKPQDIYRLKDVYQWILRTATLGIYTPIWDKDVKNKCTGKIIVGTSIDDILNLQDYLMVGNFSHRNFTRQEVERGFTEALSEESIEKKLIDNEIRYVINGQLKEFVSSCWNALYRVTSLLVEHTLILRKMPKEDPNYKNLKKWLVALHGEKSTSKIIADCNDKRRQYAKPKDKLTLLEDIESKLDKVPKWREQVLGMYKNNTNNETALKFENLKKSLMHYTYPDYIMDAVKNVLMTVSEKYRHHIN